MTGFAAKENLARFQSLAALALMVVALALSTDNFLTVDNGLNVLRQISINLCLSIGMTMIILSGGIDLSVGSVLAFSGAVAAGLLKNGLPLPATDYVLKFTVFGAILGGIAVGAALGWFNGLMITRFRLPPFVATLGMLSIARGLTRLWTGGFPITDLGQQFTFMGSGYWLGVPMPVWFMVVLAIDTSAAASACCSARITSSGESPAAVSRSSSRSRSSLARGPNSRMRVSSSTMKAVLSSWGSAPRLPSPPPFSSGATKALARRRASRLASSSSVSRRMFSISAALSELGHAQISPRLKGVMVW